MFNGEISLCSTFSDVSSSSSSQSSQEQVKKRCIVCKNRADDIITLGDFIFFDPIHVHYFCLLTSPYIRQARGKDFQEMGGYRYADVIASLEKYKFNQCYVCQKKSAAIKCCVEGCINFWHLPCGVSSNSLSLFTDNFRSYCNIHVPDPNQGKRFINEVQDCLACLTPIGYYNPVRTLISSCCIDEKDYMKRFVHRRCVLQYARNAGYDAMCITCDKIPDKQIWQEEMRKKGVYIPMQEANWERDGSFKDHVKNSCEDSACDDPANKSKVYTCYICGCHPKHLSCAGVEKHEEYNCIKCFDQSFVLRIPI